MLEKIKGKHRDSITAALLLLFVVACLAAGTALIQIDEPLTNVLGSILCFLPLITGWVYLQRDKRREKNDARYGNPEPCFAYLFMISDLDCERANRVFTNGAVSPERIEGLSFTQTVKLFENEGYMFTVRKGFATKRITDTLNDYLMRRRIDVRVTEQDVLEHQHEMAAARRKAKLDMLRYDLNSVATLLRGQGYELLELVPEIVTANARRVRYLAVVTPEELLRIRGCNVFETEDDE